MKEILQKIEDSLQNLEFIHGTIDRFSTYGNRIIVTFKDGTKYKVELPSFFATPVSIDNVINH